MLKNRLLYAAAILGCILFYIMYENAFSLLLLAAVLILPAFLWFISLAGKKEASVRLKVSPNLISKGETANFKVELELERLFFAGFAELEIVLKHSLYGQQEKKLLIMPLLKKDISTAEGVFSASHAGAIFIEIKQLRF